MRYIDLQRSFAPVRKDREAHIEAGRLWGHRHGGWLDWKALLNQQRVVLLAEAASGKSAEFRHQAETLFNAGKIAFFISIEELAEQEFETLLHREEARRFHEWKSSSDPAWFFLDSLDEARLNRKRFDTALRRLARDLDAALHRSHIFVSCRVTDWKGENDRAIFSQALPCRQSAVPASAEKEENDALLNPIFDKNKN